LPEACSLPWTHKHWQPMYRTCQEPVNTSTNNTSTLSTVHRPTRGTRLRSWLRHCTTSRKVARLITDGVIGIFHWHSPSGRTMILGLTQTLIEKSTRNISWKVKAVGVYSRQADHLHGLTVLECGSLNFLEPSGPDQTCKRIALLLHRPIWRTSHAPSGRDLFRPQIPTNLYLERLSHSFDTKIL